MKKFIFMILILLFANPSFSQTGTTAEMFGLDQCLWVETEDQTIQNNYCAKMIVEDGTLTDNGNGSFTYSPAGAGYTVFDTSQELADILTDETGSSGTGAFPLAAVFSIDPIIDASFGGGSTILGKVQRRAGAVGGILVGDDDCDHEAGKYWYDDNDSRFEFCDSGAAIPPITFQDFVNVVSSTDNAVTRFDGTSGEIQNSGVLLDDNNNIVLPTSTASSTSGIIYKGSQTWLHNYYPTGTSAGNIFLGLDAGNLTLSGASPYLSSFNIGIGDSALHSLTTGYWNIAIGDHALTTMTDAISNVAIGNEAGFNATGSGNMLIGSAAGYGSAGLSTYYGSVMIGVNAGISSVSNNFSMLIGGGAGANLTTGTSNIMIGYNTGNSTITGSDNIFIGGTGGAGVGGSSSSSSSELNIGDSLYGTGMNGTARIGIDIRPPTARLHLPAGTTSASSAPLKLDSGTLMSTPEAGAIEYNGLFYVTEGATRKAIGDLVGPASATDNAIARYDGTTGKLIQNSSGVTIDDQQNMVIAGSLDVAGTLTVGVMTVDEPNSRFRVGIEDADKIGMVIQSPSSPTAPAFEVQDSTGRPSVRFENNGFSTMRINKSGTMANASYDGFVLSVQNIGDAGEGSWIEILNSGGANRGAFFGMIGNQFQQFNWQGGDIEFWTGLGGGSPGANYARVTIDSTGNLGLAGDNEYAWSHGWGGGVGIIGIGNRRTAPTTSLTNGTALWSTSAELYTMGDSNTVKKITTTAVVALTDGATPALNAKLGSLFTLTAAGDRTIAVPSNPTDGQRIIIAHTASGANRTLALNTGAGGFRFGTTITGLTATTSGTTDYIECVYNSTDSKWDVISYVKGY